MKSHKLIGITLVLVALTGCAVGNQYDYRSASVALPLAGSGDLGVAVIDNRSYVLNGDKPANFVGLQRGGFANPFNVTTASGEPLTRELSTALQNALRNSGYAVTEIPIASADEATIAAAVAAGGKARNVILTVTDWKTDIYMNMNLIFDLVLQVVTEQGEIIAANEMRGEEKVTGGALESQNSKSASAAFETKIGRLFNHPDILKTLQSGSTD